MVQMRMHDIHDSFRDERVVYRRSLPHLWANLLDGYAASRGATRA